MSNVLHGCPDHDPENPTEGGKYVLSSFDEFIDLKKNIVKPDKQKSARRQFIKEKYTEIEAPSFLIDQALRDIFLLFGEPVTILWSKKDISEIYYLKHENGRVKYSKNVNYDYFVHTSNGWCGHEVAIVIDGNDYILIDLGEWIS